jgi:carboxynorspermidine decarboxylase
MIIEEPIITPAFVVDEERIRNNCEILASVKERTGCKILLALKGFAMWPLFPLISRYLDGVCASSPWEARLGRQEFGGEVHAYAAAYSDADFAELLTLCDEIDFNSFSQFEKFGRDGSPSRPSGAPGGRALPQFGLRINPECSTQGGEHEIYDPCAPRSRLGIRRKDFEGQSLNGISGLHFHTLCEQNADDLETTLKAVEEQFGEYLPQMEWINFGGGHHITRNDYDIDLLCRLINEFKAKYDVQVILEPGEAVALNTGVLVATVLDIIDNGGSIAILDASCTCHMPDVLEMPYRPEVEGAGLPNEKAHTYRLAGLSCLAGDVIADYSFDEPLKIGDRLYFQDMAHYSMVKTTFFNGIQHPDIGIIRNGEVEITRSFNYEDYKGRLA